MNVSFSHARIAGIVAAPGSVVVRLDDELANYGGDAAQLARIKRTVGLAERRVAATDVTALDMCEQAAKELLEGTAPLPDAVIFVTQTPDHSQPGNAALLHGRLGLPKETLAFDVNLGCSGYVYGLYLASLLVEAGGCCRVLLCAGDTLSRCVHPQDRVTAPLFGDAGSATLVERTEEIWLSWFSLQTDGAEANAICVPAGGARQPRGETTALPKTDDGGNVRTPEHLHMDGAAVFNFSLREVPPLIKGILAFSGKTEADVDAFVLHQANKYILQNIAKRCGIPEGKVPVETLARFGNTSSASIPLALCAEVEGGILDREKRVVLAGFGVGLSLAGAVIKLPRGAYVITEK